MSTLQNPSHALLFLSSHSHADAKHLGLETKHFSSVEGNSNDAPLNYDGHATATVNGQTVSVTYTDPSTKTQGVFTSEDKYTSFTCVYRSSLENGRDKLTFQQCYLPIAAGRDHSTGTGLSLTRGSTASISSHSPVLVTLLADLSSNSGRVIRSLVS